MSQNRLWRNPEFEPIFEDVKRIMGIDKGAGARRSQTMGNILTGARTKGVLADNVKKEALAEMVRRFQGDPNISDKEKYSLFNVKDALDAEKSFTERGVRPSTIRTSEAGASEAEFKRDLAGGKAKRDNMITTIQENLLNRTDVNSPEYKSMSKILAILRKEGVDSLAGNLERVDYATDEAKSKAGKAKTSWGIELGKLNFLPKKQAAELTKIEKETKVQEEKIRTEEGRQLTEKGKQELNQARVNQIKDLKKFKIILEKAKIKAQEMENTALVQKLKTEQQEIDLKIKVQEEKLKTAESKTRVAEETEPELIKQEKLKTKKGETDLTESGAKAKIALNDLKDYPAKLKFLQNKRKNIIKKGDIDIKNAETEGEKKRIALEVAEKTKQNDLDISDLNKQKAELEVRDKESVIYQRMMKTPSPADLDRKRKLKEAQIADKTGTSGGVNLDAEILKRTGQSNTTTTPTTTASPPPKGMSPDPIAVEIFDRLMTTVEPEVLKSWTPEEVDKAVAMIQEQHPKMDEIRIRRLIQTAQRRSQ